MRTRFDNKDTWVDACNKVNRIEDMSTMHLLNVLAMFVVKPGSVLTMLVQDIENGTFADAPVWSATRTEENMVQSLTNVTAMTADELTEYACESALGRAVADELTKRGVKLDTAIAVLAGKERTYGG